ncbi:hypothetical protein GNF10_17345 [Nostoc sp. UCD121]|uniref:hypothetical protein n=1 Tax=unclassified Nostoc TaxID=2593658 RepID=UPI0016291EAC|nr:MULTISPECIES: hypothetical protein [unclassified Nostoc]MBC1218488.1 hypothetical protein [Nostoc sp. UCD120]MBC1277674.1 hypothetical protein [Nostoc sp. UCD121]MBC1296206.1 hypothetical protein [Nostoc sp. UCD122]
MALFNPAAVTVSASTSGTSTPTTVASSASSVTILASNSNRKGATIWNDSTANLFIEFAATATTSAFTAKLSSDGYFEVPFNYTGVISGIWSAANGNALVRELT